MEEKFKYVDGPDFGLAKSVDDNQAYAYVFRVVHAEYGVLYLHAGVYFPDSQITIERETTSAPIRDDQKLDEIVATYWSNLQEMGGEEVQGRFEAALIPLADLLDRLEEVYGRN